MDTLNLESRKFYERAVIKRVLSLMFAALGMMFMGFVAEAGALAQVNNISYASEDATDAEKAQFARRGSGYGFACFIYLVASLVGIAMAIYISPDTGSRNEKQILGHPKDIDPHGGKLLDPEAGGAKGH